MARRPVVLLIGSMYDRAGEDFLAQHVVVRPLREPTEEVIREAIKGASGAWVRYPVRLSSEAIRQGGRLAVISTSGRGTDAIDILAATEQGIAVVNNPGLGTIPVSEHTLGLMLDLAKMVS